MTYFLMSSLDIACYYDFMINCEGIDYSLEEMQMCSIADLCLEKNDMFLLSFFNSETDEFYPVTGKLINEELNKKEIELDNKVEILEKEKVWQRHAIWLLAIFMGLQSLVFYTLVAWLPSVLVNHGISPVTAGWIFAAFQMIGFPFSYVVPKLASKLKSARLTMLLLLVGYILGVGMLIVVKDNLWLLLLACLINGITTGTSFALSLYLITVFSSSKEEVGQVSGFVQSVGYLLASSGPVIFGVLKDTFNNWNTTLLCLLLVAAFTAIIGLVMIKMGRQHFLRLNK